MIHYLKTVLYLIAALAVFGANAGSYDDFFVAIKRDDPQAIRQLLQRGFDANTLDPKGNQGLFMAVKEGNLKAAQALAAWPKTRVEWRSAKDESPLMIAALKGYTDLARQLIARDADVNKTGWAPLHYAAAGGHLDMIQLLLDENAYIDAESPNKTTPLMMAAHYGSPEAVKLLLEAGADPTLRNELGLTAANFAEGANRKELAATITAAMRRTQSKGKW
jgi:ankyrin repeat protein